MNAVDTNVFVYCLDASEPVKQAKAQQLLDGLAQKPAETLLPWQVAGELLAEVGVRCKSAFPGFPPNVPFGDPKRSSFPDFVRSAIAFQPFALGQHVVGGM